MSTEYNTTVINMTVAGSLVIDGQASFFTWINAVDGSGNPVSTAKCTVQVAHIDTEDAIPFKPGDQISADPGTTRRFRLAWAAQASVVAATFLTAFGQHLKVDARTNALFQPVTVTGQTWPGDVIAYHGASTVSTGGSILAAMAAGNPAEIRIKNVGSVTVFLSFAAADTTNGFPLDPGEATVVRRGTNQALFGATAAGTGKVAWQGWSKS